MVSNRKHYIKIVSQFGIRWHQYMEKVEPRENIEREVKN